MENQSLTVHEAASSFADMLDPIEVDSAAEQEEVVEETTEPSEVEESEELQDESEEATEDEVEGDEEEAEEVEPEPEKFTVKVDGKELEVTKDELLRGYQREADYTRKTQKLAEERRMVESEFEQVRVEREQYAQVLGQLQQKLHEMTPQEPNWEQLEKQDPTEYARQWTNHQRRQQQQAAIAAEQIRLSQMHQAEQAKAMQERLLGEANRVKELIPEWRSPERAKEDGKALIEYGQKLGFSEQELGNVTDSRALVALYKAWKFDQMMSKKPELQAKIKKAPRMATPGSANTVTPKNSELKSAKQRLASTGSVKDAAALFEKFI
jgi:hypothetical protein